MSLTSNRFRKKIELLNEIKTAAKVLKKLEKKGLIQPAIASGWTRGFLTNTKPSDIDVAYVGNVHYLKAQKYLNQALEELGIDKTPWDIKGIWNAQMEFPEVDSTEQNYLLFYVNSIDSIYLASDGKLHDPTGHGFDDAKKLVLRMNDFEKNDFNYPDNKIVYLCLEGCRRIAKFNWKPTKRSKELILSGLPYWEKLSKKERDYFYTRTRKKYSSSEQNKAKIIYQKFGWDFVFKPLI
jgi:hypothetical protein